MGAPLLAARGIRKHLGDRTVLDGVDLEVDRGRIVVLMGPNGTGKTLLLNCLTGGLRRDGGSVKIDGRPAAAAPAAFAHLPQSGLAIGHLTGRETVAFYAALHPRSTERWRSLAVSFDLVEALDRQVRSYSGGMRRKLELLTILSVDVPLYVLDEPSAGLDLDAIRRLHDRLLALRSKSAGVLISSHLPIDLEVADEVRFLEDGSITAVGEPHTLQASLPPVVRFRGSIGRLPDSIDRHLLGARLFARGDEARGFLPPGTTAAPLERQLARAGRAEDVELSLEAPTFSDLYHYWTQLEPTDRPPITTP